MNPEQIFCPNLECPARGQQGRGNIGVHQAAEQRYICHECHKTFSATKGTIFHGLKTEAVTVLLVRHLAGLWLSCASDCQSLRLRRTDSQEMVAARGRTL